MLGLGFLKLFFMRFSVSYHEKVVSAYWSKAPATHGGTDIQQQFVFYATEIDKLLRKYLGKGQKRILDHGAGEGSIAINLSKLINGGGYNICVSEMFDKYRDIMKEKGLEVYDSMNLPKNEFDGIFFNNAFFYIHPSKWRSEITRLLESVKDGGYLFLTDVPTVRKIPVLYKNLHGTKKLAACIIGRVTTVYQFGLGGFFVDERKIKIWFPGTVVEDESCDYRSFFIIKKQ